MASELTDEDRATAIEHAQHLLRELERQHRTGHDSLKRFHRERVDALLLLEMDAELRTRRAREKALREWIAAQSRHCDSHGRQVFADVLAILEAK